MCRHALTNERWEMLFPRFRLIARGLIRRHGCTRFITARSLTQSVMMQLRRRRDLPLDIEDSELLKRFTWRAQRVIKAKRRWRDRLRPHEELPPEDTNADDPQYSAERAEKQARVREALAALDPKDREVVILHYFEDLTIAEIAEVLGKKPGTVKSRLHRARLHLAELLGK